ncbi:uncharacterized protein CLUP02_12872 [Colletotrichum lupini]|uniref:Amidase domain-containing protein n=1 Tax=Colletotrichum lupini TaxID=145971 RepID=A0A9Q8WKW3_9PEZI|nr:uncharacterized protein CLUP02_12872 [Colletotrichum lupini]UQC87368.1 hypothetical protein CLUP02_12872 [Colletotrichum lupini]
MGMSSLPRSGKSQTPDSSGWPIGPAYQNWRQPADQIGECAFIFMLSGQVFVFNIILLIFIVILSAIMAVILNIVEASIEELHNALNSGSITSVELVTRLLRRISTYDSAKSDDRRASGEKVRPLEGIPYTVKDSYKVKGMVAAAGSPAFEHLISNEDAFLVKLIQDAGGVLIGRTNMPAMACGGMQRGIWGRAENPYNPDYLAAAFASGSSNGSAVSTAASFAAFGLGGETVSSGRSPASNNALIAYTPSRTFLSNRGSWPLYPTCDVPVPHTRSMKDMLTLLDVITAPDPVAKGDLWREQRSVQLPQSWEDRPESFKTLGSSESLSGLVIAVPEIFLGGPVPEGAKPIQTSPAVVELWKQAGEDLESLGAKIVMVSDFPPLTAYENDNLLPERCPRRPADWHATERGALVAHTWNNFLRDFNDSKLPDISAVDASRIYPDSMRTGPELQHFEKPNAIQYHRLAEYASKGSIFNVEGLDQALKALEGMQKVLLEDWLTEVGCDCVVFPATSDQNGVHYSNGNRAIRHLGIPTVSVPMGILRDKRVPMSLTFAGRAYDDIQLLRWANAFEIRTKHRSPPLHTPYLKSDLVQLSNNKKNKSPRPKLIISTFTTVPASDDTNPLLADILVEGSVTMSAPMEDLPEIEITIDAQTLHPSCIDIQRQSQSVEGQLVFSFRFRKKTSKPPTKQGSDMTLAPVARDKIMVVVLAKAPAKGSPSGWMRLI